ncbi:MAG TPA: carnitine 3-dehydrogenase [Solirubrobacteraceae bacterium]
MPEEPDAKPRTAALLGGGVIGGGWAARLLMAGVDVRLYDPADDAEQGVIETLERARRAWRRLTIAPLPPEGRLTVAESISEAVSDADLVQESAPEREALKRELLVEASHGAPSTAIIASSTSGLLPSKLSTDIHGPERFLVAHPFNPVYLLPLVELVGGPETAASTIERAASNYRSLGMRPLVVRHEIDGFIADRLLEALWREALWLVSDDVATVEEVDDAITYGAGLRFAAMGIFLTYRLGGGEGGMGHFLEQFGPALELPWTRLTDVPTVDQALREKLVTQSDAQADGRSVDELTRLRDDCLVAVLHGLRGQSFGAGEELARYERALIGEASAHMRTGARDARGSLKLHQVIVPADWIDYNGHLTESRYLDVLAESTDAFLRLIGIDGDYIASGHSYYTVETHIRHLAEASAGEHLYTETRLLAHDQKRLHLFHQMRRQGDETLLATGEHMLLHVDRAATATAPAESTVLESLAAIADSQRELPWPEGAGRVGRRS